MNIVSYISKVLFPLLQFPLLSQMVADTLLDSLSESVLVLYVKLTTLLVVSYRVPATTLVVSAPVHLLLSLFVHAFIETSLVAFLFDVK